jgi:hypothetical protein
MSGIRSRVARLTLLALAPSLIAPTLAAGPAQAAGSQVKSPTWDCPFGGPRPPLDPNSLYYVDIYSLVSSTQTFLVADSRIVINTLDTAASATFTSSQSRTFTLQFTFGTANRVSEMLTLNFGATVVFSQSTSIGVTASAMVAPHSSLLGEYGVAGFDVAYDVNRYQVSANVFCKKISTTRGTASTPTTAEGWRIRTV